MLHYWNKSGRVGEEGSWRDMEKNSWAREDGVAPWGPYTDHDPVEITLGMEKNWQPGATRGNKDAKETPDWRSILGPTLEAAK